MFFILLFASLLPIIKEQRKFYNIFFAILVHRSQNNQTEYLPVFSRAPFKKPRRSQFISFLEIHYFFFNSSSHIHHNFPIYYIIIKVLGSSHVTEHACMRRHMDIGRANLYEQVGRQAGSRIQVVIARACNAEQSTFII